MKKNDTNIINNTKIDNVKSYRINKNSIKTLETLIEMMAADKRETFIKERIMFQIEDLIETKIMTYLNVFLVMNSLEENIEYYSHSSNKIDKKLFQELKVLHTYFSKYFSVLRNGFDFLCIEKKTNRTFALDFTLEVA